MAGSSTNIKPSVYKWWEADDEFQMAREMYATLSYLDREQLTRREKNLQCLRMYGNVDYVGLGPFQYTRANSAPLPENRVKMNIIASMVDTIAAKISKMKPKVTFMTAGGDFEVQDKARKLEKFVEGLFYENHVHKKHQAMFRDGLVIDLGALKHYVAGKKIHTERVLATELYVDYADAMYGKPSHMYHVKYVAKDKLIADYPEKTAGIRESAGTLTEQAHVVSQDQSADFCVVMEGWHLDSGDGDGWHVIATDKVILHKKKYKKKYFPFTFSRWVEPFMGFYGQSLAERLMGNQVEINKMLRIIQRAFHLGSSFKVFLEYGSKVSREHINNDVGSIVYFSGQRPEYFTPQTVHPEYFAHLKWLVQSAYEESGISQLSAQAKLPAGMDGGSGKALRTYNDLETERFIIQAQTFEQSFMDTARIYVDLARDIGDYEVAAESKRFTETINWNEIELEDNEMVLKMFPTSMMPDTPSGQLAYVRELMQDGFIDQNYALGLLQMPDVEAYAQLKTAPLDDILYTLHQVLYKGKFLPPEPYQNIELGLSVFQNAYLRARADGAPEKRLELIRRWIVVAQSMVDQSKAMAAQGQQQPGIPAGELLRAKNPGAISGVNPPPTDVPPGPGAGGGA